MKWLITILFITILWLQYKIWFAEGGYRDLRQLRQKITVLEQENEHLLLRNQTLEAKVKDLKQGLETVEDRARSELGMIKDGETFYHIIEKPTPMESIQQDEQSKQ